MSRVARTTIASLSKQMSDYGRMRTLVNQMEGRLSYGRLIGDHARYAFSGV